MKIFLSLIILGSFLLTATVTADSSGRIYGVITTVKGDTFEGLIRWDKNEGNWVDILNGSKKVERSRKEKKSNRKKYGRDKDVSIELFGIKISGKGFYDFRSQSDLRFGHIRKMKVLDDDTVLLTLKSGQEFEVTDGSTDIGSSVREIIIEDASEGENEFVWEDIDQIKFSEAPKGLDSELGDRLFGTIYTRRGDNFTGYVCWDYDEIFTKDILDGDEKGRRRRIKFGKIASIERYSSSGATVILKNGKEMVLKGTNDVNRSNNGIIISDPGFGQVIVKWGEFEKLEFHPATNELNYADFDGGRKLVGKVYTEDGDSYEGTIRWDNDEEYTWEILDGEYRNIDFDIEFSLIRSIAKKSRSSSIITVLDGRSFRLKGSNDVNQDNKGIFVMLDDGEEIKIDWEDFEKVEFRH